MMMNCLWILQRKCFGVADECDDVESTTKSESSCKKPRVQSRASFEEETPQQKPAASEGELGEQADMLVEVNTNETMEELGARMKEMQEAHERVKKEAEQIAAKLKKIEEEALQCMVCQDMIQNPQLLHCGHSACYSCLRNWWTQLPEQLDGAEMIDTEAETEIDDEAVVGEEPHSEGGNAGPHQEAHPPRRQVFPSAVNRKKICPYCNEEVRSRPVPDNQLRGIIETVTKDLAPIPSHIQTQREPRLPRRRDLWHGIFHPENEENHLSEQERLLRMLVQRLEPEAAPPPPPLPDPILNHIAQAQHRRKVEEAIARREREHARAYEDGRRIGSNEARRQRQRAEQARQVAIDREQLEQRLAPGNLPIPPGNVPDVIQIPADPVPDLLDAEILPLPRDDAAAM